jgi:hypothetical protein
MTEQEAILAATLFPAPPITVLLKPEKFKETHFALFIGTSERDGTGRSFALPLVSRKTPSAAPTLKPIGQTRVIQEAPPAPPIHDAAVQHVEPAPLPQAEEPAVVAPPLPPPAQPRSLIVEERTRPNGALWLMAGAAAAFACLAAYGLYISAVPIEVPLNITAHGNSLVVSWPAEIGRAATEAKIRVNNSVARELAPDEKASGTASVDSASDSVEIELILRRWGRESHSIERYLRTAKTSARSVSPPQASAPAAPGP